MDPMGNYSLLLQAKLWEISIDLGSEGICWGVLDVMGVGKAKIKHNFSAKMYKDYPASEPEDIHLASRAQMNQVEQMASYMVSWRKKLVKPALPFITYS